MRIRLNGWQRLWVVAAVVWLATAGVVAWQANAGLRTGEVYLDLKGRELPPSGREKALESTIQRMIDADEAEETIAAFIRADEPEITIVDDQGRDNVFPPGTD